MHKPLPIEARAKLAITPEERRLFLADFIESGKEQFDMNSWADQCGTPLCMAGWAVWFWGDYPAALRVKDYFPLLENCFELQGQQLLGLDTHGYFLETNWKRAEAVKFLREY